MTTNTQTSIRSVDAAHKRTFYQSTLGSALLLAIALPLVACGGDNDAKVIIVEDTVENTPPANVFTETNLTIAHINDHHSHLAPEGKLTFVVGDGTYEAERGGFARIKTVFDILESRYADTNFLKLHAGDAITGSPYFSFFQGDADADMMNTICFDAFELGNHEFDESDAGLKRFLDRLHGNENNANNCQTPVLGANVKPTLGTPLAVSAADDYIKPYIITTTKEGVKVGIIGIDIKGKTKNASRPLETTEFLDEVATAQTYIDVLKEQGIRHIVLLTHYTYANDITLANALTDVDVIIGGDSHTLLGDFTRYGKSAKDNFGSQGAYPTVLTNKEGDTVCIGQAWEYTKAVGLMQVAFDKRGAVASCTGSAIIPVGETFARYNDTSDAFVALDTTANQALLSQLRSGKDALLQQDVILPFAPNAQAQAVLASYTKQIDSKLQQVIAQAETPLCLVRVPGTTRAADIAGCENTANFARGSDAAQIVAEAFLDGALEADFALQNAGGVRETVRQGKVTYDTAYTILPFGNKLVNLQITGAQVKQTLEDAISNYLDNEGSDGSHPYAAGLRWDLDMSQMANTRVSNIEVRDRARGVWSPLTMTQTYTMVTNDYIAEGRDGYTTLGVVTADGSRLQNTELLYTQAFIDYAKKVGTLARPVRSEYSHKSVITADGQILLAD